MTDPITFNTTSFERYFVSRRMDFSEWLETFLQTGVAVPFSFPTRDNYDLGDLLEELLSYCRGRDEWVILIENSFRTVLQRIPHNLNLHKLSAIGDAVARARFRPIAKELAAAVKAVAENVTLRPLAAEDNLVSLIKALDKTVACVAKLAIDETAADSPILQTCQQLFAIDELALFSSSLFAPLALSHIAQWPQLWASLEKKAHANIDVWGIDPTISPFKSVVSMSNGSEISTYFDLGHVMRDFIAQSTKKGIMLAIPRFIDSPKNRLPRDDFGIRDGA